MIQPHERSILYAVSCACAMRTCLCGWKFDGSLMEVEGGWKWKVDGSGSLMEVVVDGPNEPPYKVDGSGRLMEVEA